MNSFLKEHGIFVCFLIFSLCLVLIAGCESIASKYFESKKPAVTTTTPQQ